MQEFAVNKYLTLKLERNQTNIYVHDKKFVHCKYLLISISPDELENWDHFDSMDEVIEATNIGGRERHAGPITTEEAFWGHCSNLQAWAESGYNYRVLDTKLSIPIIMEIMRGLLKKKDKEGFKEFLHETVNSLDDYIINSLSNEATYNKFNFLYKMLFRIKDRYFSEEEIAGSIALKQLYDRWLPKKQAERHKQKLARWEAKLWGTGEVNLNHRRYLRMIRNATCKESRDKLVVSDEIGYLPYLYSTGKFSKAGSISTYYLRDRTLIIRDEKGIYWGTY